MPTSDAEERAVQTFTLDVSAGHRAGGVSRSERHPPKKGRGLAAISRKVPKPPKPVQAAPTSERHAPAAKHAHTLLERAEAAGRTATPPWLVSLVLHAAVLLVLSFCTLATLQSEDLGLWASSVPRDEIVEEFPELEIDPSVELDDLETELPTELEDPGLSSLGDLSAEAALSGVSTNASLPTGELDELGTLFGDEGHALSDFGSGAGGATTTFFGTEVKANRILFMLDNSGGMGFNGKFETLVDELLKTVDSMDPKQRFYVVFYSDTVYPLFYPHSEMQFVRATEANKQQLREWLATVELCMGNAIDEALAAADEIHPDIVFLLTDGELFTTPKKQSMLLDGSSRRFPIYTFGMGAKRQKIVEQLQLVADANHGTYRAVEVTPEAIQLSKTIRRPYRNWENGPGTVWGTSFAGRNPWQNNEDGQRAEQ